jgi:histone acetyltransferase (RNA polymerase elongator complex component)
MTRTTRTAVYPFFIPQSGCPFQCLFCNQFVATGQAEIPTTEQLVASLDAWLPESGAGEIAFYGGSFTLLPSSLQKSYLDIAQAYIKSGRAGGIRFSTRPDGLGPAYLDLLHHYPVTTVEVGCQSFSDQVLAASRRGYVVQTMLDGIRSLRAAGHWRVGLQLMPGLPAATPAEALDSLQSALALKPNFLRIYPTLVLAGTALEQQFRAGTFSPLALPEAVELVARMTAVAGLAGVPVERLGLQGEPGWEPGRKGLCAGPYHPAFGQLVRSALWRRILDQLLAGTSGAVTVPRRLHSDVLGHRRENLEFFTARYGHVSIAASDELNDHQFLVDRQLYNWRRQLARAYQEEIDESVS